MVHASRAFLPGAVRVGGVAVAALLDSLRAHGVQLNDAAETLFGDRRFAPLDDTRTLEIAALSVAELGFVDGATYAQLVARARESGLLECPLELGPHLRLQFLHQPEETAEMPATKGRAPLGSITVASAPLDDRDETPKGFYLRRTSNGVRWLRAYWSWPGHRWSPDDVFVFCRNFVAR